MLGRPLASNEKWTGNSTGWVALQSVFYPMHPLSFYLMTLKYHMEEPYWSREPWCSLRNIFNLHLLRPAWPPKPASMRGPSTSVP
ncbi:hypothetical protein SKAU_G00110070 [Synaphobranchus kaupii]|uniref:Uncharacterized protein n=1 Tax=Synaphobranchus kaupii TaxID=118154 RepID=A0A9Q1G0Z4_SYNKA|nr:hypothetical protein SKAU_G00110070 [Synaphobranchus kaupii]